MPRPAVNFHHVARTMEKPAPSFSRNRHPFLVLDGEHGQEIHYGQADGVHNDMLRTIDRSRVRHAGSLFIDPLFPYTVMGVTRVSWDNPEFGIAPDDVISDVQGHIRDHIRQVKGPREAEAMRFTLMKLRTPEGIEYE